MKKGSKILVKKGSHASASIRRHGEPEPEKIVVSGERLEAIRLGG